MSGALKVGEVYTELGYRENPRDANAYEKRTAKLRRESKDEIVTHAKVDADTAGVDRYQRKLKDVNGGHDDLVRGSGRVKGAFGSLFFGGAGFAAGAIAIGGVVKGVASLTKGYTEHQRVARQTNAVIKSTGGASQTTAKEVGALADALERKTTIDGDVIQSGANMLLTFTNIKNEVGKGNDVFNQAVATATDMSAALGTDASQAAVGLGKALNDPIKGITALSRVGVTFTEDQKKQITQLVKHGDTLKAQKIILAELGKEFGGSAEAAATPIQRLVVRGRQLGDAIGEKVVPYVNKAATALTRLIDGMSKGTGEGGRLADMARTVGDAVRKGVGTAFEYAGRILRGARTIFNDNRDRLEEIGDTAAGLGRRVIKAFGQIVGAFKSTFGSGSGTGKDIRNIIGRIADFYAIMVKVEAAVVKRALPGIVTAFRGLALILRGVIRVISGILTGDFGKAWDGVKDIFRGAVKLLAGLVRAGTAPLRTAAAALGKAIGGPLSSAWDGIVGTAQGFVNRIIDVLNKIPGVNIGHVGGDKKSGVQLKSRSPSSGDAGGDPAGRFAEGGKVTMPIAIMGEEAPTHPEWVIPTNPAYRQRAIGLWMSTARDLGIPGFALGGLLDPSKALDFVSSLPGKAANSAKGLANRVIGQLPKPPGGILGGAFDYALDKAKDFIGDKAKSVWGAAKSFVGAGGDGSGASGAGTTKGTLGIANRVASMFGLHITSGYRNPQHNAAVGGVPNSLHTHGSPSNPGAVDLGGARLAAARAWAASHLSLKELLVHDVGSGLHLHLGFFRKGGLYTGGEMLPGGAMAYKKGGKTAKKPPKPMLTKRDNRGIKRSVSRGEKGIASFERRIQTGERQYDQRDRRYGLSDEVFLIENDDGSTTVDTDAVKHRVGELDKLTDARKGIKTLIINYRKRVKALMDAIKKAIHKLQRALKAATGKSRQKERGGYRQAISDYNERLRELRGVYGDLGIDIEDQRIDLKELDNEKKEVQGTTGTPAPAAEPEAADEPAEPEAPAAETAAEPAAETPAEEPAPAPPSAEDIARSAAEQIAAFGQQQSGLFAAFGSNFVTSGAGILGPGGMVAPSAALRGFGAFGAADGPGGEQAAGGQPIVNITNNFAAPPPDPHTWTRQQEFELDSRLG